MDIQNITGPDTVPRGFSATYKTTGEQERVPEEETSRQPPPAEENKGNYIDTYV
jgi:hypothetical protein